MRDRLNDGPLAAIVSLLRPRTVLSNFASGAGRWAVQYSNNGHPSFFLMTTGACWLGVADAAPFLVEAGDFVLLPAAPGFRMGSDPEALRHPRVLDPEAGAAREVRHGSPEADPTARMLGGFFLFDPINAPLLVSLLPTVVHIKATDSGGARLAWMARAIGEEAAADQPGRNAILARLVEVMLIEALRWRPADAVAPLSGVLAGLADSRLAIALRQFHDDVARRWTIEDLAGTVNLSRAAFAARFMQVLGVPPMEYVRRWRMALAKELLWHDRLSLDEVAHAIGYQSVSAFSAAFSRSTGMPPGSFARAGQAA